MLFYNYLVNDSRDDLSIMKKGRSALIGLVLCVCMALLLAGCGSQSAPSTKMNTEHLYYLTYSVPSNWNKTDESKNSNYANYYNPSCGGAMIATCQFEVNYPEDTDVYIRDYFSSISDVEFTDIQRSSMGDGVVYDAAVTRNQGDGVYKGKTRCLLTAHAFYELYVIVPEASLSACDSTISEILDSMSFDNPNRPFGAADATAAAQLSSKPTAQPTSASSSSASATTSQLNALKKAKSYLNSSAFSHSGLIDQLEYEKFSADDATYAADNCGADWNSQAAKKAQSYMKVSSFSRDGLIDQLEYDGFTEAQAEHGADSAGL